MLSRAEVVQLELPFVGEYNVGAPRFSEGISFMDVVGFSPYDIVEQHRLPTTGKQLFQIDVLFLRKTSPIKQASKQASARGVCCSEQRRRSTQCTGTA